MTLDFEKPMKDLQNRINDLKSIISESNLDLSMEIDLLESRLGKLEDNIYSDLTPWQRVQMARHKERPTTLEYIPLLFTDFFELFGDRLYGDDKSIIGGIAKFEGIPVTIIGQQKGRNTKENIERNFGMPHPEGYRKALRLMKQAEKFNRPIITFIDTPGAYPGKESEERGISEAIARNLVEMSGLRVPVISIVLGEGASGGAIGLSLCNHLHMLENTWYSVISPEGAASILWKTAEKAPEAAKSLKLTAKDLEELKIIDKLIPEIKGGAHKDIHTQSQEIRKVIKSSLKELCLMSSDELIQHRFEKYRTIGEFQIL
ncbi:acetyl-CoA carboxylase carboxyltransferase subunit alpha (plasmid) [Rossellomorea marisflavi]|uniref:acetyl-CoA carboxylase carboxyltransferase subunit alpha n=1 Tax=Rossellomorea marisflavi TaxID=189381 RepID=UPI0013168E1A|nr:acetyl-CoA carboxylase carboxyltransferase subunit alpha [Rossellomorea marisflavi]QHA38702.1 acetyl-CoA carboxylase carboxyltransferase subunit alpha [Rossellomorea marisflavi]